MRGDLLYGARLLLLKAICEQCGCAWGSAIDSGYLYDRFERDVF